MTDGKSITRSRNVYKILSSLSVRNVSGSLIQSIGEEYFLCVCSFSFLLSLGFPFHGCHRCFFIVVIIIVNFVVIIMIINYFIIITITSTNTITSFYIMNLFVSFYYY